MVLTPNEGDSVHLKTYGLIAAAFLMTPPCLAANQPDRKLEESVAQEEAYLAHARAEPDVDSPTYPQDECAWEKSTDPDCVATETTLLPVLRAAKRKMKAMSDKGIPFLDRAAYCKTLGDDAGSYDIEKACADSEREAEEWILDRDTEKRILRYCGKLGEEAGGSYDLMKTCIEQEESAEAQL